MNFASDNTAPAHPGILAALAAANDGFARPYGTDPLTEAAHQRVRDAFEAPGAAVFLVPSGTAANALALGALCPPWGAVYCHPDAHVMVDECGAPEFYTGGAKLVPVPGAHGRIDANALERTLAAAAPVGVHNVQPGALSLTNLTEAGTAYDPAATSRLTALARGAGIPVHLDGARLANAVVATGASLADLTWRAGIDAVSFGGTKNGCLDVEAVVYFDPARARDFAFRRKRGGHLFSKHRFLAAQMLAYLEGGLWHELAGRANAAGARLAAGLAALPGVAPIHPPEGNILFFTMPRRLHRAAFAAGAVYELYTPEGVEGPDETPLPARLVTSWCTEDAEVDRLLGVLGRAG